MPKYTEGDLVALVDELHDRNGCSSQWGIYDEMKENGDTILECVVSDENAWDGLGSPDVTFYAYSQNYIYFLEMLAVPQKTGYLNVNSVPRHPTTDEGIAYYGRYV